MKLAVLGLLALLFAGETESAASAITAPSPTGEQRPALRMKTYTYKEVGGVTIECDVYRADGRQARPVLVWLHSGGMITGDRRSVPPYVLEFARSDGFAVVSLDYRLAPEVKLPAIIEDVRDAFSWIRLKGRELAFDVDKIVVAGASAGGYLALMTGYSVTPRPSVLVAFWGYGDIAGAYYAQPSMYYLKTSPLISEEEAREKVGRQVLTGASRGSLASDSRKMFYRHLRQNGRWIPEVTGFDLSSERARIDAYCPIRNVTPQYPPTILIHGTKDTDIPYEASSLMAEALARHEVPHELVPLPYADHDQEDGNTELIQGARAKAFAFIRDHLE